MNRLTFVFELGDGNLNDLIESDIIVKNGKVFMDLAT